MMPQKVMQPAQPHSSIPAYCFMQVAFNVMLPCMLFTKVASTLASSFEVSLIVVPVLALLQVNPCKLLIVGTITLSKSIPLRYCIGC